ncbi:hypothetical protein CH063_12744 [Colletotrichum higginsianum]|uniref:Uncharacterized protein n=1 Tax=Colletotrichum higginsianum (strain IMI 349063) TaxID=759273 RepID=H1VRL7_COLHI|nr:hypothetical protein CH063_12744 [Colletotrichum higginsianum]
MYTKDKVIKGMLLNAFTTVRDFLGSEVIITTLGGGRERNSQGDLVRVREARPFILPSCHAASETNVPIGIILGLPVEIKHSFNVLAFFIITDIWSEKDDRGFDIHKIRLEKTNPAGAAGVSNIPSGLHQVQTIFQADVHPGMDLLECRV